MLYRIIMRIIASGKTNGLKNKIDVFWAAGKISENEYNALIKLLNS